MTKRSKIFTFNFMGGIIAPGPLLQLLNIATDCRATKIRLGLRQQLIIEIPEDHSTRFTKTCTQQDIQPSTTPNLVSSYFADGLVSQSSWLSEGIYKDIFALFDYTPTLKINICDSQQTFVPLFTGHINWIISAGKHFWHLYLRLPGTSRLYAWPELIYTTHIPLLSKAVETHMQEGCSLEEIYLLIRQNYTYISQPREEELSLPAFHLPYYEGFNKANDTYWLGIYRRDEIFPVAFLKEICTICLETHIGQLYATPWKSVIIKNINPVHRSLWDYILGKHGINVRHAANELNWQVEDNCEDGLILKRHIIRYFDKADTRTYGLCFSIRIRKPESLFGSIVVRRQGNRQSSDLKYLQRYDILHTGNFDANNTQLVLFREGVTKEQLGPYIVALCRQFYELRSNQDVLSDYLAAQQLATVASPALQAAFQCRDCFTVYDPEVGDSAQGIAPGTGFGELPEDYCCAVCGAPLSNILPVP
jgi:rubredoxin